MIKQPLKEVSVKSENCNQKKSKVSCWRVFVTLTLIILVTPSYSFAQSYWLEIVPSTSGTLFVGVQYNFNVIYHTDGSSSSMPPGTIQYFEWSVPGQASVIGTSTPSQIKLIFNTTGSFYLTLQSTIGSNLSYYWGEIGVNISGPPTPITTFSILQNCGQTTVNRNSYSYSSNVEWYWQTEPLGESTSLGSGSSITRTQNGPLYLRARLNVSPYAWSDALFVGSIVINSIPQSPTVNNEGDIRCGSGQVELSGTPSAGSNSIKWYNANGTLAQASPSTTFTPTISVTTTYYMSSYNTTTGCESSSTTRTPITATVVEPSAASPGTLQIDPVVGTGSVTIDLTGSSSSVNRFTIKKPDGTLAEENFFYTTPFTFDFPTPGVWEIYSRPELGGIPECIGATYAYKVIIVVPNPPATPNVNFSIVQNPCGTMVTRNTPNPPSRNIWYWQTTADGTSTAIGSDASVERTTNGTLYLRARLTVPPYTWSEFSQFVGNIEVLPISPQIDPINPIICSDRSVTISGSSPAPNTLYWYEEESSVNHFLESYSFSTPPLTASRKYWVSAHSPEGCESDRVEVNITVIPLTLEGECDLNENYILVNTITTPNIKSIEDVAELSIDKKSQSIQYFDGLGRPIQTVLTKASPLQNDIVQVVDYDGFGRESTKYLPYVEGNNGWLKQNAITKQSEFYNGSQINTLGKSVAQDASPYSTTIFEPSPLNRVIKQGAPGFAWQPDETDHSYTSSDHTIKFSYEFNTLDEVLIWDYQKPNSPDLNGVLSLGVSSNGSHYYNENQLYKNRTKDENNNEVIEYTDKEGRTILKKVQLTSTTYAETYYVYDVFGNLVIVLPPQAVAEILNSLN